MQGKETCIYKEKAGKTSETVYANSDMSTNQREVLLLWIGEKQMKYIEFDFLGEHVKAWLRVAKYYTNGNLGISLCHLDENGEESDWCDITTNLGIELDMPYGYVNPKALTNLIEIIERYNLAEDADKTVSQGYNIYGLYKFNMNEVKKYAKEVYL